MVAAAIVGAGVVEAAGSAVAANTSANATQSATNANIAQQQNALSEQAQLSQPYRDLGQSAIPGYENLLGIGPQGSAGIMQALQATPGYQFALTQGQQGIQNAASAQGGISGNTLEALTNYNQGLASQTYQQNVGDIAGAVASGQAAAAGQAQNVGTAAANIGNAITTQGQTNAGIDANLIAGLTKTYGTTSNNLAISNALNTDPQMYNAAAGGSGPIYDASGAQIGYQQ